MAVLTGRYGTIKYDPAGILPVSLISLNKWKMSQKTDKSNVTCFGDLNKVYVPGLKDINGSLGGFWNSTNVVLWQAVDAATPGLLALAPNSTETAGWSGLAYLDADIDCGVDGAPAVSGSFMAAGAWTQAA
jgi:hypothetical protein